MGPELLEIQPRELKFTFELKKQSSCSVRLVNKSNEYVGFKVKTTSPKRYCVRPNTGVVLPRSTCDFTVTMQAQRTAPPDMQLKDKFLVQSTVVPFGTTNEEILPSFFSKENGRYIEENKLRVVLVSPPHSPVLQPINGALKQEMAYNSPSFKESPILKEAPIVKEASVLKDAPSILKETPILQETPASKDHAFSGVENLSFPSLVNVKEVEDLKLKINNLELKLNEVKEAEDLKLKSNDLALKLNEVKEVEDLKLRIKNLESKLNEADETIAMLREDKDVAVQERDKLQRELVLLGKKRATKVQVGFPFLFVVFVALVGLVLGYSLRS